MEAFAVDVVVLFPKTTTTFPNLIQNTSPILPVFTAVAACRLLMAPCCAEFTDAAPLAADWADATAALFWNL